jgi:hypothetical protein
VEDFKRVLETERYHTGANTKFDAHMEREAFGKEMVFRPENEVHDASMKSRLIYGQRRVGRHGLKELAEDFTDPDAQAAEAAMQARHKELVGNSDMKHDDAFYLVWKHFPHEVEDYARKDAEYTRHLDGFLS